MDKPVQSNPLGAPKMGLLDHIIFGLLGTPDSNLAPQDLQDRQGKRREAAALSRDASSNPGDQFMWAPGASSGSNSFGLGDIIKLFAGGGG